MKFKRYCKTLKLKNNSELIEEYKELHARGNAWHEITEGMKKVGIIDMEIYIYGTRLFMIMETVIDFNHDIAMKELSRMPRQKEWETLVSKYQDTTVDSTAAEKWKLIDRIYKLDQKKEEVAVEGYIQELN